MDWNIIIAILIIGVLIVEAKWSPRINHTREGKILLWYDSYSGTRRFIILVE